ncbi:MAG TPA: hypothetical protein VLR90_20245 [Blastocatellia bacterium]|nr:hypothetical protein [Blastocatellia bacterium]
MSAPTASKAQESKSDVEELRRLVEKQQQLIDAQQKRLEALERKLEEHDKPSATPTQIGYTKTAAGESKDSVTPSTQAKPDASATATPSVAAQVSKEITREGFGIKFYGFLRGDMAADTSRMSNDPQLPFFVLSPDDPSQTLERSGDITVHPRLTRFGVDITPPKLPSGWASTGKLEIDFYNTVTDRPAAGGPLARDLVSNSRAAPRIRLAYVQVVKGDFSILAGQNWDVISPLFPSYNAEVVMWNGGNTGDRRPQFRLGYEPKVGKGKLSIVGAIGSSGAVDNQDLDGDGFRDGEASETPTGQLRVGYSSPLNGQNWSVGFWGHGAKQQINRSLIAGRDDFTSSLFGMDLSIPILPNLTFRGEAWKGRGLSDVRGGIGQSINTTTGQVIGAVGGWAELSFRANSHYTVSGGTTLDNPYGSDISAANGRVRNRVSYITNRFTVGRGLSFGFDYGRWLTRYKVLRTGTNNRFNLFVQQAF